MWPQSCGLRVKDRAPKVTHRAGGRHYRGLPADVPCGSVHLPFEPTLAVKTKAISGGWVFLLQSLCENFYHHPTSCIDALGNARFGIKINILSEVYRLQVEYLLT